VFIYLMFPFKSVLPHSVPIKNHAQAALLVTYWNIRWKVTLPMWNFLQNRMAYSMKDGQVDK